MNIYSKLVGIVLLSIALLLSSSGCSKLQPAPTIEADYVTFTYSRNVTDDPNSSIVNEFWYYDSVEKVAKKVYELEYTSQYPLGYYDKTNNQIYYTKSTIIDNTSNILGDQIFVTDLNTNTEQQLTNDIFAVNYVIPLEEKIIFVARPQGANVLRLGSINKKTGEIAYWGSKDTIDDINIENIAVNQKTKKVYVTAYSDTERRYNVLHQDGPAGKNNFKMPLHTVYEIDYSFEQSRVLFSENEWIRTLMTTDDVVVALSDKQYNEADVPSTLIQYNVANNSVSKTKWDTYRLQVGDANYSSDGSIIYSISEINKKRGLYEYSVESKTFQEIFIQSNGFLNNIQVAKYTASQINPIATMIVSHPTGEVTNEDLTEDDCIDQNAQIKNEDSNETFIGSGYDNFKEYMRHHIPTKMEPSTLLTYGEDNEPIITKIPSQQTNEQIKSPQNTLDPEQEEVLSQEEDIINEIKKEASCLPVIEFGYELPSPEPGLVVMYGTDGLINRYYYEN